MADDEESGTREDWEWEGLARVSVDVDAVWWEEDWAGLVKVDEAPKEPKRSWL